MPWLPATPLTKQLNLKGQLSLALSRPARDKEHHLPVPETVVRYFFLREELFQEPRKTSGLRPQVSVK